MSVKTFGFVKSFWNSFQIFIFKLQYEGTTIFTQIEWIYIKMYSSVYPYLVLKKPAPTLHKLTFTII